MFHRINNKDYFYLLCLLVIIILGSVTDASIIRVENRGAYVARTIVRYKNPKGDDGMHISNIFSAFRSAIVQIEDNAKSIEIEVQVYSFINSLATIFKTSSQCPHTRCFVIWGTIFKTEWNEICC